MKKESTNSSNRLSKDPINFLRETIKTLSQVKDSAWVSFPEPLPSSINKFEEFEKKFLPQAHIHFYSEKNPLTFQFSITLLDEIYWEKTTLLENNIPLATKIVPQTNHLKNKVELPLRELLMEISPSTALDDNQVIFYNADAPTLAFSLGNHPELNCIYDEERIFEYFNK